MGNIIGTICDILIYNIISIWAFIHLRNNIPFDRNNRLIWILILLLCLFPIYSGDYIHYHGKLFLYEKYGFTDMESIYGYIISLVNLEYILFRFIVWGSALVILNLLFKRLVSPYNNISFAFFAIWGILFYAYPRVSLALSIFFFGYSFFAKPLRNRKAGYILGLILLASSTLFHKSLFELLLLVPFSFIKLTKTRLILYTIGLFVCVFIINKYVFSGSLLLQATDNIEYLNMEAYDYTTGQIIVNLAIRIPLMIMIFLIVRGIYITKRVQPDKTLKAFVTFMVLISLLALMWLFCNIQNQVPFYRTLYMVFIPLSIAMAYIYRSKLRQTTINYSLIFYLSCNLWLVYCLLGHINGSIQ